MRGTTRVTLQLHQILSLPRSLVLLFWEFIINLFLKYGVSVILFFDFKLVCFYHSLTFLLLGLALFFDSISRLVVDNSIP